MIEEKYKVKNIARIVDLIQSYNCLSLGLNSSKRINKQKAQIIKTLIGLKDDDLEQVTCSE